MDPKSMETTEEVFNYIKHYIKERSLSPTIREIAAHCYISKATVIRHLDRLEAADRITRELGQHRSIRIVIQ